MTYHRSGETIGSDALRRFGIADIALWTLSCVLIGSAKSACHMQFVIERSGTVLSARVVPSSGFASLDGAGMELIGRLPKLPAPPSTIIDNPISLVVAVNFALR